MVAQSRKNHAKETSAPSDSTADSGDEPALVSAESPSPLRGHLKDLADRARGYVEAARSASTRKAYASD